MEMYELPAGWQWRRLADLTMPKEVWNQAKNPRPTFRYIDISSIDNVAGQIADTREIPGSIAPSRAKRITRMGDVLFATTRPYLKNVAIVPPALDGEICSTGFCVLRPRRGKSQDAWCATTEWIYYACRSALVVDQVIPNQEKSAYLAVSDNEVLAAQIPVPPFDEQRRIVTRTSELIRRAEEVRKTVREREAQLANLLQAFYHRIIDGAEWKALAKVASLVRRPVKTAPDEEYEEMGIRSFGKGTFTKPVLTGTQLGSKRIYRIHKGDLVFNNVFAWEKAIAVARKDDHGRVGSHRFITYVPHEGKATPEFLCLHFLDDHGIEDIRAASPGSAGRNRTLGLKTLELILVPVPGYDEQRRCAELVKRRQVLQQ